MDVVRILRENNIKPKKELDQYFLVDEKMISKEVALASLSAQDVTLDIGAGPGNLTEIIAKKSKVIAIEKDYSFRLLLKNVPNANVLFGDALEILESLRMIREKKNIPGEFNKVVSNIPYSISQNLLIELLRHPWGKAVLVVQKEFAQKLIGKEKLALAVNDCCDVKIAEKIPAGAFYPKAVESAIVVLKQRSLLDFGFWEFLSEIFKDKNRNVKNVVKSKDYPLNLAVKKIHQLTIGEIKQLYEAEKPKQTVAEQK
jgi:16S rRNA (adenine1518-N6/adenine1519-N6)-dimethyltransferase